MSLMHEALARAHCQERMREAESERAAVRHLRAQRLQRRAARAERRAQQARQSAAFALSRLS